MGCKITSKNTKKLIFHESRAPRRSWPLNKFLKSSNKEQ
jgi:hypothetical protein